MKTKFAISLLAFLCAGIIWGFMVLGFNGLWGVVVSLVILTAYQTKRRRDFWEGVTTFKKQKGLLDFKVGEECILCEDRARTHCRIYSRDIIGGAIYLGLEVLQVVEPAFHSSAVGDMEVGRRFVASQPLEREGPNYPGKWHLEEVPPQKEKGK